MTLDEDIRWNNGSDDTMASLTQEGSKEQEAQRVGGATRESTRLSWAQGGGAGVLVSMPSRRK